MADYINKIAGYTPETIGSKFLEILRNYSQMLPLIAKEQEYVTPNDGPVSKSDVSYIPKLGTLTVGSKANDTDMVLQNPSSTQITLNIDQHKYVYFGVEDIAAIHSMVNLGEGYIAEGIRAIAEDFDTYILGLYSGLSTNVVGTPGTDASRTLIVAARKALNDSKIPLSNRNFIWSTKDEQALLNDTTFTQAQNVGDRNSDQVETQGFFTKRLGFDHYVHQGVVETGSSPTTTHCLAFHRTAFVAGFRQLKIADPSLGVTQAYVTDPDTGLSVRVTRSYQHAGLAEAISLDILYGGAVLREEAGVHVQT